MTPLLNIKKDMAKAVEYFEMAAEELHIDSLYNLGYLYEHGIGVEQDGTKAISYYEKAAQYDDVSSIQALIRIYNEGTIIQRNDLIAQTWKRKLNFEPK